MAVAESSAGGLISACLLAVPGASAYFLGGAVVYTAGARRAFSPCPTSPSPARAPAPRPTPLVKARAVQERLGTTLGPGRDGGARPTGNRYGDAAGHACIAVTGPVERAITVETGQADREANMWAFTRVRAGLAL